MMDKENAGYLSLRFCTRVWFAWLLTAMVLLALFSLFISQTATSEQTMAYISSAISFFSACGAGRYAAKKKKGSSLLRGLVCAVMIVFPLMLCGLLIDREKLSSDAVLSVVSLSVAGSLFGSVFLGFQRKERSRRHSVSKQAKGRMRS